MNAFALRSAGSNSIRTWAFVMAAFVTSARAALASAPLERQLTTAAYGHVLTNTRVWSPDGQWLVYDVRSADDLFDGTRIEAVNADSGEVRTIYSAREGACCGIATWHPEQPEIAFVLGPARPDDRWRYGATHRQGMLVAFDSGQVRPLDAATYAPPFVAGALRGGSHVHVFSPDGAWVSFTYEDNVLAALGEGDAAHDPNQRNIGVAVPAGPVRVGRQHPRNHDGDWFCVLVSRTTARPRRGSDDISRACEEGWIGRDGYQRADGTRQRRALAFQGTVTAVDGREHVEVFVADLPDDLTKADEAAGPLEGTTTRRPAPPRGVVQRRLTFTEGRVHRGLQGPRHWLRSSPDGAVIACLMRDDTGAVQLWLVPTVGGIPHQLTHVQGPGVASAFSWNARGDRIAAVINDRVCVVHMASGAVTPLTPPRSRADAPLPYACVFSPDDGRIAYLRAVAGPGGRHWQVFTVEAPGAE